MQSSPEQTRNAAAESWTIVSSAGATRPGGGRRTRVNPGYTKRQPPLFGAAAVRCLVVLAILLTGCSGASKTSQRATDKTATGGFVSKWRPPPEPEAKPTPPPPPARAEAPPPPDPAAEQRRAEAARRKEEDRRKRAREQEFARLPPTEQRRVVLTGDALTAKGLDRLTNAELAFISRYSRQFPAVSPADLAQALAVYGDRKGARDHLASLGVTDPDQALRVRTAFGLESQATCDAARAAAEELGRVGLAGISDRSRAVVARHPHLFPSVTAATPALPPAP
jgi:hypothetical protein